ncbi:MAG: efflux RND transporter periplasmic adaptor subunit [Deltaproteobacteria bacterium]|nr:efflux RND transporter periplasmic adaptor subunit [Deltaproteobacteria bacterium]
MRSRPPAPDDTPEVRSAASAQSLADDNLRRAEELAQRGVFTPAQLDEARARAQQAHDQHASALQNVRGAIAALGAAEAQLSIASTAVNESTVRAPFAGEIAARGVSPGEFVTQQSSLVTLVRTDPLRLELQVPQERVSEVRVDQSVFVTVDAFPDARFEGRVRYISASVDRASRAMIIEAVVPNADGRLRPGMFVSARIELGGTQEVAVVPPAAISTSAGVSRAFVVADGHVQERVVTVLERTNDEVVLRVGVTGGETVATSNLDRLGDGVAVTVGSAQAAGAPTPPAGAPAQPVTGG